MKQTSYWLFLIIFWIVMGCSENDVPPIQPPYNEDPEDTNGGDYQVELYFSQVYSHNPLIAENDPDNIDKQLVRKIDAAQQTIDAALYKLDNNLIQDALIRAYERGVSVRVVGEYDYASESAIWQIQLAGIEVVFDRDWDESYMHNKFVVIDETYLWTGSMNTTYNGANKHNNNAIWLKSPHIAENYTIEFEEMFLRERFSTFSEYDLPYPTVVMSDGTTITTIFSPEGGDATLDTIIEEIRTATTSIRFMAFSFTRDDISAEMIHRFQDGLIVEGIFEDWQVDGYAEYQTLLNAGVPVILDTNPNAMHHKVIIIDDDTVITGSYNFSSRGTFTNDENLLIILNNQDITLQYLAEFDRLYSE